MPVGVQFLATTRHFSLLHTAKTDYQKEANLYLLLVKHHAMKTYGEVEM
jgi:hypothetical protein